MITAAEVEEAVLNDKSFYWGEAWSNLTYSGSIQVRGLGEITKIDGEVNSEADSYGDYSGTAFVVVKVAGQHFRKNGYVDSYGEPVYDGALYEVEEKTETVTRTYWASK